MQERYGGPYAVHVMNASDLKPGERLHLGLSLVKDDATKTLGDFSLVPENFNNTSHVAAAITNSMAIIDRWADDGFVAITKPLEGENLEVCKSLKWKADRALITITKRGEQQTLATSPNGWDLVVCLFNYRPPEKLPTHGELRREQMELLEKAIASYAKQYEENQGDLFKLIELRRLLVTTRLPSHLFQPSDSVEYPDSARKSAVKNAYAPELKPAQELEALVASRVEAGVSPEYELLLAKAYRLEIEAELAEAEGGRARIRRPAVRRDPKQTEE